MGIDLSVFEGFAASILVSSDLFIRAPNLLTSPVEFAMLVANDIFVDIVVGVEDVVFVDVVENAGSKHRHSVQ